MLCDVSCGKGAGWPWARAVSRGGFAYGETPLRCSVSWPAANSLRSLRSLRSNMRSESVNEARCARGHEPCASRRHRCPPKPMANPRLCSNAGVLREEVHTRRDVAVGCASTPIDVVASAPTSNSPNLRISNWFDAPKMTLSSDAISSRPAFNKRFAIAFCHAVNAVAAPRRSLTLAGGVRRLVDGHSGAVRSAGSGAARAARFQLHSRCACLNGATAGSAVSSQRAPDPSTATESTRRVDRPGVPVNQTPHTANTPNVTR